MDSQHDPNDQLDVLTDALDDPGTDLQTMLTNLLGDVRATIPSVFGLSVTVTEAGDAVTIDSAESDPPAATEASLHVPLDVVTSAEPGSTVTFYASRPGAFVDLAADIRYAYCLDGQVVIDGHLDDLAPANGIYAAGVTGLAEMSVINRAIGVLIGQQHPQNAARRVLQHRANQAGTTLALAAQRLLDELTSGPRDQTRSEPVGVTQPPPVICPAGGGLGRSAGRPCGTGGPDGSSFRCWRSSWCHGIRRPAF